MAVAEKLEDAGEGMDWAKDVRNRLRDAKRYLKGDYKVKKGSKNRSVNRCHPDIADIV